MRKLSTDSQYSVSKILPNKTGVIVQLQTRSELRAGDVKWELDYAKSRIENEFGSGIFRILNYIRVNPGLASHSDGLSEKDWLFSYKDAQDLVRELSDMTDHPIEIRKKVNEFGFKIIGKAIARFPELGVIDPALEKRLAAMEKGDEWFLTKELDDFLTEVIQQTAWRMIVSLSESDSSYIDIAHINTRNLACNILLIEIFRKAFIGTGRSNITVSVITYFRSA